MHLTPHISIYTEGNHDYSWLAYNGLKAQWIFASHLGYIKQLQRIRVNIHLGDEERIHPNGTIKSIWIKNEFDAIKSTTDLDKLNHALGIYHKGIRDIGVLEGWDINRIDKAYNDSISSNGNFQWYSAFKQNKVCTMKARIRLELDKGSVNVIAEVFNKKESLLFSDKLIETFTHFIDWEKPFSKPIWIDNSKFGFSLIKGQLLLFVDTATQKSQTVIEENDWTKEELEGQLRRLTFREFSHHEEFVKWANQ